jgi:hypothetical protein
LLPFCSSIPNSISLAEEFTYTVLFISSLYGHRTYRDYTQYSETLMFRILLRKMRDMDNGSRACVCSR